MSSSTSSILVVFICKILITLLLLVPLNLTLAQQCNDGAIYCWSCSETGTTSDAYQTNLNSLLLSNISSSPETGQNYKYYFFRNASSGQGTDEVNAIGLCRGDLKPSACSACLNETSHQVLSSCRGNREAVMWSEHCIVRYSNQSILSVMLDVPSKVLDNPSNRTLSKTVLDPLIKDLVNKAASSDKKYAYDGANVGSADPVYALLQCTPDLNQSQCGACLRDSASKIPEGKLGARVLKPSCTLRFESGIPFYKSEKGTTSASCSQDSDFCWSCYGPEKDTNPNSVYLRNLQTIMSSFSNKSAQNAYGFYNLSMGENQDRVNLIAMCRGDLSPDSCQSCVRTSSQTLISGPEYCPNRKRAIAWQEKCVVRYSNESIFSVLEYEPSTSAPNPRNASQLEAFELALGPLLNETVSKAASGDWRRKYAPGKAKVEGYDGIYATAQCTPDLDERNCTSCLQEAVSTIRKCCQGTQGVKILKPSCVLRYEVTSFYGPTADMTEPPKSPPPPPKPGSNDLWIIIVSVVASVTGVILICICIFMKLRRASTHHKLTSHYEEMGGAESLQYDLGTIRTATDNFSEENKLGRGGFGDVYRGRLSNGQFIAVKRLSKTSDQGDKEFKNEVTLLAKLQHRNLVRVLGFCLDEKETLLVYEFVPNSSLDKYIFNPTKRPHLDWGRRHKIINGIARGLLYIHEDSRLKIIHCDLKAGNILLDEEMNPKISDFGMARLFALDETQGNTKKAAGTYGYMAPEYAIQGHFSVKSDVFSFGVLLLEIISGQRNGFFSNEEEDQGHLLTYAFKYWSNGTVSKLIDPLMVVGSGTEEIIKCIQIGLLCVQENLAHRPTMNLVVHMLNSRSHDTLAVPTKPGFFMGSSAAPLQNHSTSASTQASVDDAPITELYPRW